MYFHFAFYSLYFRSIIFDIQSERTHTNLYICKALWRDFLLFILQIDRFCKFFVLYSINLYAKLIEHPLIKFELYSAKQILYGMNFTWFFSKLDNCIFLLMNCIDTILPSLRMSPGSRVYPFYTPSLFFKLLTIR